jgi:four helix bundle protein
MEDTMYDEIRHFTDLLVWQKSLAVAKDVYRLTIRFPREEIFGITSQIRRAAVSITCNIAEGFGRYHFKDKIRFYYQARGSVAEVENILILARELGYVTIPEYESLFRLLEEVYRMLNGLIRSVGEVHSNDC